MSALRSILFSSLAAASASAAADSTHELRAALQARGDFNGDGRPDIAVIERSSGQVRVALTLASGTLDWGGAITAASPRPAGWRPDGC
jgi:hypothetical protein